MKKNKNNKIDEYWIKIFNELQILQEIKKSNSNHFIITAEQIKQISNHEPRLMCKFDFASKLPKIFKDNNLSLLAIKNGEYLISSFNPFIILEPLSKKTKIIQLNTNTNLDTLNFSNINNESAVLDISFILKILHQVFNENELFLTLRGRHRANPFKINSSIHIDGVQIEIDGGYESSKNIYIIEGKNVSVDSISIRQLIYPKKSIESQGISLKNIKMYVCIYTNGYIRFIELIENNEKYFFDYSNEKVFKLLNFNTISVKDIHLKHKENNELFPQANDFNKINDIFNQFSLTKKILNKDEIFENIDFELSPRQQDYYIKALCWLDLITINNNSYQLSNFGISLKNDYKNYYFFLLKKIFEESSVCYDLLNNIKNNEQNYEPSFKNLSISTQQRRIKTIENWILFFKNIKVLIN